MRPNRNRLIYLKCTDILQGHSSRTDERKSPRSKDFHNAQAPCVSSASLLRSGRSLELAHFQAVEPVFTAFTHGKSWRDDPESCACITCFVPYHVFTSLPVPVIPAMAHPTALFPMYLHHQPPLPSAAPALYGLISRYGRQELPTRYQHPDRAFYPAGSQYFGEILGPPPGHI